MIVLDQQIAAAKGIHYYESDNLYIIYGPSSPQSNFVQYPFVIGTLFLGITKMHLGNPSAYHNWLGFEFDSAFGGTVSSVGKAFELMFSCIILQTYSSTPFPPPTPQQTVTYSFELQSIIKDPRSNSLQFNIKVTTSPDGVDLSTVIWGNYVSLGLPSV